MLPSLISSRTRSHIFVTALITTITSCNAFRAAVIQAPTQEEKDRSYASYSEGKLSGSASVGDLYLHKDFRSAEAYCKNIMLFGQDAYRDSLWLGIPLTLLGTGATAASTTWAATSDDKSDAAVGKITLAATSAVVAAIGLIFVGRASAAATASGDAGLAFVPGTKLEEQWKICLTARAKWLGSNAEAANIAKAGSQKNDSKGGDDETDKSKEKAEDGDSDSTSSGELSESVETVHTSSSTGEPAATAVPTGAPPVPTPSQ